MSGLLLERFLALPPIEQRMLELLAVVHAPLSRSGIAEWLRVADLRSPKRTLFSLSELAAIIDGWDKAKLCSPTGRPGQPAPEYRLSYAAMHTILAHAHAQGTLDEWVELVRRSAPLANRYGYLDDRYLARELMLTLYSGWNEPVQRALSTFRPPQGSRSDVFIDAFGLEAPLEGLKAIGFDNVEAYLERAFELASRRPQRVGNGLLAFVQESSARLNSHVIALVVQYLALVGEAEAAQALAESRDDAELNASRCLLTLLEGDSASARQLAKHALDQTRAKKSKKLKGLAGTLWPWVLLPLYTDTQDAQAAGLAREQLTLSQKKHGERAALLHPFHWLESFFFPSDLRPAWDMPPLGRAGQEWQELLFWALACRFTGKTLPDEIKARLLVQKQRAEEAGFPRLAHELAQVCDVSTARGLAGVYVPEEPWQRALRALDAAVERASQTQGAEPESVQERLVWTLLVNEDGTHTMSARLQTRLLQGFSGGRQISWKKLHEAASDSPWLSDQDRRVIRHISTLRDSAYYGATQHVLDVRAPLALIGHPRVFADQECRLPIEVVEGTVRIDVHSEPSGIVVTLAPRACLEREVVCERDGSARVVVYALNPAQQAIAEQLSSRGLRLPEAARQHVQRAVAKLVDHFPVASEVGVDAAHIEEVAPDSRIHLQLRRAAAGLLVRPCVLPLGTTAVFAPGVGSSSVLGTQSGPNGMRTLRCVRDLDEESARLERLLDACPTLAESECDEREHRIADLSACLELLCELRRVNEEVVVDWPEGQTLSIAAEREVKDVRMRMAAEGSWLSADGSLEVDKNLKLSLRELLDKAGKSHGRFIALDDGRFLALSEDLRRTLDNIGALAHTRADKLLLHPLSLFGMANLSDGQIEHDALVGERLSRAREAGGLKPELPHTFEATLRPYQIEGYAWLSRLAHWGAGACLADDMGLGKTLQTLALLVAEAPKGPSLVVAPTSVCSNWLDEARKFAPSLRLIQLGMGDRAHTLRELSAFDVLVCSYGILQQERELLSSRRFQVLVLDEAQAIKNASTLRAKAALELVGEVRIALTGTPVENHLGELWSIMSFLNPGLLGSAKAFEERFAKPIQRDGDKHAAQLLKRLVRPFVLRRKKSEVLDDLPEKTVITLHVEPSAEERALFAALREQAIARMTDRSKPAEARMRLLAELTRMRRAACHPDLVAPQAGVASSKLATFEALLDELRQGGHRVLVFSQFVDYLSIVRSRLEALSVPYQYLDGSTAPQARARAVKSFQAGEGDVFLISLKAGGFGLNLTAADYVVHLDPWWNPAVEDQASDRAHRIGQTRPVTIYRLVMEGSIEEKILALHAEKRDLADQMLEGNASAGALAVDELMQLIEETNAAESASGRELTQSLGA